MDCPKCGCEFTSQRRPRIDDTLVGAYGHDATRIFVLVVRHAWHCWGCDYLWRIGKRSFHFDGNSVEEEKDDD